MNRLHRDVAGSGPPLILLHGWALHAGLFAPLIPGFTRRFRVHAVDLPGHGYSSPVVPYSLDAIVQALEDAFAHVEGPLCVLGWSLGGMLALRWAHATPQRIAKLILVATTPRFVAAADWSHAMAPETLARFADELRVTFRLTLQRFLTLQVQGSAEGIALLKQLRARLFERGEPSPAVLRDALALLTTIDLRQDAARILTPALVVTGDRDRLTPAAAGDWLARTLPNARYANISGAAHAPFLSHRRAFTDMATSFLDGA
ncbi:MAG: pimeloyl-ACP methyl ester esterase BioH [Casimicrobiaceae bacterium]